MAADLSPVRGKVNNKIPVLLLLGVFIFLLCCSPSLEAQGGPPYYTNDPGTPGTNNWEINLGYMPFLYTDSATSHVPDVDINFGLGKRIQLTYESAWLRVKKGTGPAAYGMEQSNPGLKWRFYQNEEKGLEMSIFPQGFINNPNHAVQRGISPPGSSFEVPIEFTKKVGPVDIDWELGYNAVHRGPDGWIAGLAVGHDMTKKLEIDAEFYSQSTFNHSANQQTIDAGARYKLRPPFILLLMAGRSVVSSHTGSGQPYFIGYFGMQFLLPPKPFDAGN
jgi:hypothetical protein